ncbi:chymotrypsin inhibitor-like [Lutzomyia longipalpis]|uniref:chymotrypsin inhibitor-like n=1 Tax=Lutzomyia longipalpis TaxID=7200 RepID=UPI00248431B8|nr:chymotrypsin inhibitor-like [Lutzomyia longipalpis]
MKTLAIVLLALVVCAVYVSAEEQQCGPNQVFKYCGNACDNYCDGHDCGLRYFKCPDKCYCVDGYLRNNNEECIPKDQCP